MRAGGRARSSKTTPRPSPIGELEFRPPRLSGAPGRRGPGSTDARTLSEVASNGAGPRGRRGPAVIARGGDDMRRYTAAVAAAAFVALLAVGAALGADPGYGAALTPDRLERAVGGACQDTKCV